MIIASALHHNGPSWLIAVIIAAVVIVGVVQLVAARQKGYNATGTHRIVRCSRGHVFTTVWIPFGSFKAVRLGATRRFEYCPVGKHWALVRPVKEDELTDANRKSAAEYYDRIP